MCGGCNRFVTSRTLTGATGTCIESGMSHALCRLLLVDGQPIVRHGLKAFLGTESDMVVSAEAARAKEALEQVRRNKLDVVVIEPDLPDVSGLEIISAMRRLAPDVEILLFTNYSSPSVARAAFGAGARGYALKSDKESEFIRAVRCVWQHKPYVTLGLAKTGSRKVAGDLSHPQLSACEATVMELLANGFDNKQVAFVLGISRRTVEAHREHIMRKLRFGSFSDLIRATLRKEKMEHLALGPEACFSQRSQGLPGARVLLPRGAFGKHHFCPESIVSSIRNDRNEDR